MLKVGFSPAISASANRSRKNTYRAHRLRRPGTSDTCAAINRVPLASLGVAKRPECALGYDQHVWPQVIILEGHADDDGVRVHHGSNRDSELQRTIAEPRTALHLDLDPPPVVQSVHKRIDAAIQQPQEHVQSAVRAHHQLDPHFPFEQLTDDGRLAAMPGIYVHVLPAVAGAHDVLDAKPTGSSASRFTSRRKISGRP